jgi:hypothetical protein
VRDEQGDTQVVPGTGTQLNPRFTPSVNIGEAPPLGAFDVGARVEFGPEQATRAGTVVRANPDGSVVVHVDHPDGTTRAVAMNRDQAARLNLRPAEVQDAGAVRSDSRQADLAGDVPEGRREPRGADLQRPPQVEPSGPDIRPPAAEAENPAEVAPPVYTGPERRTSPRVVSQEEWVAMTPEEQRVAYEEPGGVGERATTPEPAARPEAAEPEAKPTSAAKGVSRLATGVEAKAVEAKLTTGFEGKPEYSKIRIADQAHAATDLVASDHARALRVARGEEPPPEGLLPESVFVAVEQHALRTGDVETLRDLATRSTLPGEASGMGQRIRMLGERDSASPVRAIADVTNARRKAAERGRGEDEQKNVAKTNEKVRKLAEAARRAGLNPDDIKADEPAATVESVPKMAGAGAKTERAAPKKQTFTERLKAAEDAARARLSARYRWRIRNGFWGHP